jgi:pimeloyl-ACP methyl ester carboxylesterase
MVQTMNFATKSVRSKDGTTIGYRQYGKGPGIIVLPGALATAKDFDGLTAALGGYFTVYTVNRRGRPGSGEQGADYSIQKEIDDVAAVQRATKAEYMFGHSFGGFLALEYARSRADIKKVIVYEPGVSVGGSISMDWEPQATKYLSQNKPLDAFVDFVRAMNPDSARAPRWVLRTLLPLFMKKSERLQKYALLSGTIKEHAEEARLNDTYPNYKNISADVLLLRGSKESAATSAFKVLEQEFPAWQTQVFSKLDHFGPEKAPGQIADAVYAFAVKQ